MVKSSDKFKSCGGCGATNPKERCLGCFHRFTNDPDEMKGYMARNRVALQEQYKHIMKYR